MTQSLIVVGAGLTGLCTAIEAASRGLSVTVFEKSKQKGGRARSTQIGGATLNLGAHALYRKGCMAAFCKAHKIKLSGGRPKPQARFSYEGRMLEFPIAPAHFLTTRDFSLLQKTTIARWLVNLESRAKEGASVATVFEGLHDNKVRRFLESFIMVSNYSNDFERLPSTVAFRQSAIAAKGILYLDGGFQSLSDALLKHALSLGVRFIDQAVTRVESGATLTRSDRFLADHIIVATPQKDAKRIVVDATAWPSESEAMSVSALDLVLEGTLKERLFLSVDEGLYFSVHSQAAKLCVRGQSVAHLIGYKEQSRKTLEAFLRDIEPKTRVLHARYLPKMNVQDRMPRAERATVEVLPRVFIASPWASEERLLCDAGVANVKEIMSRIFKV